MSPTGLRVKGYGNLASAELTFERQVALVDPRATVRITCVDFREDRRPGYLLTSAGNVVHPQLLEDLHLIVRDKELLLLKCHTDCLKSQSETTPKPGESVETYKRRVEQRTMERLWQQAGVLLSDGLVQEEIKRGLIFCAACYDVTAHGTEYFEEESETLVRKMVFGEK